MLIPGVLNLQSTPCRVEGWMPSLFHCPAQRGNRKMPPACWEGAVGSYGDTGGCLAMVQWSRAGVVLRCVVRGSVWGAYMQ